MSTHPGNGRASKRLPPQSAADQLILSSTPADKHRGGAVFAPAHPFQRSVSRVFAILGILVVFGAVLGGYLMEKGNLLVLVQPPELLIIGGAALGTLLIANPIHILKGIASGVASVFGASRYGKERYLESLRMMFGVLTKARREGNLAIEQDIETPQESKLFAEFPAFLKDHHTRDFVCDTLRMIITGGVEAFDIDQMMELDMEVQHHDASQPISALTTVADALPGLGIVAAVLGVVITMGALGGPPAEIGHKVAAALVGTFLGILLCYGLVGPIGAKMSKAADEERCFTHMLRVLMLSAIKGTPPQISIEIGRRAIPLHVRPSFAEVDQVCRGGGAPAAPAEGDEGKAA
jgi:chemotaxis protein MotA